MLAVAVDIFGGYWWSDCHHDVFKTVFNYDAHINFSGGCLKSSQIPHCSFWYDTSTLGGNILKISLLKCYMYFYLFILFPEYRT